MRHYGYDFGEWEIQGIILNILGKLIRLHKFLFFAASLFTLLTVFLNLYWNRFLADTMAGYDLILGGRMSFSEVLYCIQVRGGILAGMSMLIVSANNIRTNAVCIRRIEHEIFSDAER